MKISYIGHAALLIETGDLKIITDPWLKGPAYCNQWYIFPKPVDYKAALNADYILYSHGHEDHFHPESLTLFDKKAKVFFPFSWYDGVKEFCASLGFNHVTEAINEKTYRLDKDTEVTYFSNNLDNVIVIEHKGKVIVNVNDALPSAPQSIMRLVTDKIKNRYSKIDYLFSSYGGASYFPNCIKFAGKDDMEIGKTREMLFLHNFFEIIKALKPAYAVPFASDFILLDDEQRWMNETKIQRSSIKKHFEEYTHNNPVNTAITIMYPGDFILNDAFNLCSPYHAKERPEGLLHLVDEEYKEEIAIKRQAKKISEQDVTTAFEKLKAHVNKKLYIIPPEKRAAIKYAIQLTDYSTAVNFNIDLKGATPKVYQTNTFEEDNILLIKLRSDTLLFSLENEWGGDAIIIGYGCLLEVFDIETIASGLDTLCVRLITNYPNTKEYLKRVPFRAIKYLLSDSIKRNSLLGKVLPGKEKINFSDPRLADNVLWLSKTKCEICKACNLPEQVIQ